MRGNTAMDEGKFDVCLALIFFWILELRFDEIQAVRLVQDSDFKKTDHLSLKDFN